MRGSRFSTGNLKLLRRDLDLLGDLGKNIWKELRIQSVFPDPDRLIFLFKPDPDPPLQCAKEIDSMGKTF